MRGARPPHRAGQSWATFLRNHANEIWACDFLPVTDLLFRPVYAFVVIALSTRRVAHVGVTRHPTDAWVAQQLREATPFDQRPRSLIRDSDGKFGSAFARVATTSGIDILRTPVLAVYSIRHASRAFHGRACQDPTMGRIPGQDRPPSRVCPGNVAPRAAPARPTVAEQGILWGSGDSGAHQRGNMDAERLWDEYNKLPAEAQHQVADFLAFLRLRHADQARRGAAQRIDWEHEPFVGMWRDRDDMPDGGRWVRDLRAREWSRGRG